MDKDNTIFLRHILDYIGKVERYLQGVDYAEFLQDTKTSDAVIRNVEVIGEAATNLNEDFRAQHSQVEWRKIIATRNRIIHGYATVDLETIWGITQNHLPPLKAEIEKILESLP